MHLFAIVRQHDAVNNEALSSVLSRKFPDNVYRLGKGQWLVADDAPNAARFSEAAGISAGKPYTGTLVIQVDTYYGLHDRKVWDWIKSRIGEPG